MDASKYKRRAWLEVDLDALDRNVRKCRQIIGDKCALTAVVKSDAYGLGAEVIARELVKAGADVLAVACLSEAERLRRILPDAEIMILGDTPLDEMPDAARLNLICTIWTEKTGG